MILPREDNFIQETLPIKETVADLSSSQKETETMWFLVFSMALLCECRDSCVKLHAKAYGWKILK